MTQILLCDNGSKKPAATLMLRHIAHQLSQLSGHQVEAVSLQHADSIPPQQLENRNALVLPSYLQQKLESGINEFLILPLFFGNSRALTSFIPQQRDMLQQQYPDLNITIAEVLYPLPEGDQRLAEILFDHIQQVMNQQQLDNGNIVIVDHGSPLPAVIEVKNKVTGQLTAMFDHKLELAQAVMERRQGKQYEFNGELLEQWLMQRAQQGDTTAIVGMLFLLPGRHAGEGGDIAEICQQVMQKFPGFRVYITPLIGEHAKLIEILHARLSAALQ